ncbi:quinone oxidoreductase [uncultured Albimonas sp.]|uniref:quinone oxidoreductase family protein n=1 Tax=uncultured Albimonas sp. TaxID=1331701 RepID=UPI0030EE7826|tara:strand:+ start:4001 stop:4981 length:981 start_codon:yes stop_codon:yes gene_type:complete
MTRAIRFHATGGPEVLRIEPIEIGDPGPGEVRLRQTAIGVNFTDVYSRSGLYPAPLPCIPGREAAGVVEAVGEGVEGWAPGDRASYASVSGAYVEARLIEARRLIRLPEVIDDRTAAAATLRGLTAHMLLHAVHTVRSGETILVHAAAGGVGAILTQWAASLGAVVIGVVSSPEKAALARAGGCAHVIVGREADIAGEVAAVTGGAMVSVVYDAVGRASFARSLDSLARRGHFVSYGQASGPIPPIAIQDLGARGSLTLTRPMLGDYIDDPSVRAAMAESLFARIASGAVRIRMEAVFPFEQAAEAHRALESGATSGSVILIADPS